MELLITILMGIFVTLLTVLLFSAWFFHDDKPIVYLKYYLFDWDDNLLYMPSQIYLLNKEGFEVAISTGEYAIIRKHIDKSGLSLMEDSFRDFKSNLNPFLRDIQNSTIGPSWNDFVEAINTGAFFSIITARGHSPEVFKETIKIFLENDFRSISKDKLIESLKKRKEKANEEYTTDEQEIEWYLNQCLFYPISYYDNIDLSTEQLKKQQIEKFIDNVIIEIKRLNQQMKKEGNYKYKLVPKFGFSDDDLNNIDHSLSIKDLFVYSTHNGDKNRIK
jgi:hypothetical protein